MPDQLPELDAILHSGNLAYGKWGKCFEEKLRNDIGNDLLVTTNTYASAIQVALTVLGLQPGDEVITSPMSCLASNQPLVTFGLKIIWADIDPATGTLDPESVKNSITSRTKLIVHNHFCGYAGYIDEINAVGKEYGIPVIDDCVEAFGSVYKNRKTGNLGTDITLFSFQTVRLPNTIDGGAITFRNKEYFEKALLVRDFGINRAIFRDKHNEISPECDISQPGYGATMSDVNSYIGCLQMDVLDELLENQQNNAITWDQWLEVNMKTACRLNKRKETIPNYWVYGFLSKNKLDDILRFREMEYYASGVHLNNNNYSVFGDKEYLLGVEEFNSEFIAIPCGWWANIERIFNQQELE
jgi:dTDP-4-amino-4,6-dideoxygalactose transaminase